MTVRIIRHGKEDKVSQLEQFKAECLDNHKEFHDQAKAIEILTQDMGAILYRLTRLERPWYRKLADLFWHYVGIITWQQ